MSKPPLVDTLCGEFNIYSPGIVFATAVPFGCVVALLEDFNNIKAGRYFVQEKIWSNAKIIGKDKLCDTFWMSYDDFCKFRTKVRNFTKGTVETSITDTRIVLDEVSSLPRARTSAVKRRLLLL